MTTFILDIGKTHLKGYVLDEQGKSLWSTTKPNTQRTDGCYPYLDVDDVWRWLLNSLREAATNHSIRAINISTHGACAVLLDEHNELALPVMDYEFGGLGDSDNVQPNDTYEQHRPPYREAFSPQLPAGLNLGRQLWWQRQHYPEQFAQVKKILLYPQYWAWKLSGVMATEVSSLGCHTDLWQPTTSDYSPLVSTLGLQDAFPAMVPAMQALGVISPKIYHSTELPADCQVFAGVHDSNASFARYLSAGLPQPFTVVSTGTWVITMAMETQCEQLQEHRDMLANVSVLGTALPCARFMGGREFDHICTITEANHSDPITESDVIAILSAEAFALPGFVPGTGPFPDNIGELIGTSHCGKTLATLYLALMIDTELSLLNTQGDIVFGSSSHKNPLMCQLIAQLRPRQRVLMSGDDASTVKGAWCLTRWGQEMPASLTEFTQAKSADIPNLEDYRDNWRRQTQKPTP